LLVLTRAAPDGLNPASPISLTVLACLSSLRPALVSVSFTVTVPTRPAVALPAATRTAVTFGFFAFATIAPVLPEYQSMVTTPPSLVCSVIEMPPCFSSSAMVLSLPPGTNPGVSEPMSSWAVIATGPTNGGPVFTLCVELVLEEVVAGGDELVLPAVEATADDDVVVVLCAGPTELDEVVDVVDVEGVVVVVEGVVVVVVAGGVDVDDVV